MPIITCPSCKGKGRVSREGFGIGASTFCGECQGGGKVMGTTEQAKKEK